MRNSELNFSHVGPFHSVTYILQPGNHQSMVFSKSDPGPCYLTVQEREKQHLDDLSGKRRKREFTRAELAFKLKSHGLLDPKGTKKSLQDQCIKLGIELHETVDVVVEGWVGKPKGALQILFVRGRIDPELIGHYSANGKKSAEGFVHADPTGCDFSIKAIMKLQKDFMHEMTLLQFHAYQVGVTIDRTPKCRPEMAGEGVEYA